MSAGTASPPSRVYQRNQVCIPNGMAQGTNLYQWQNRKRYAWQQTEAPPGNRNAEEVSDTTGRFRCHYPPKNKELQRLIIDHTPRTSKKTAKTDCEMVCTYPLSEDLNFQIPIEKKCKAYTSRPRLLYLLAQTFFAAPNTRDFRSPPDTIISSSLWVEQGCLSHLSRTSQ